MPNPPQHFVPSYSLWHERVLESTLAARIAAAQASAVAIQHSSDWQPLNDELDSTRPRLSRISHRRIPRQLPLANFLSRADRNRSPQMTPHLQILRIYAKTANNYPERNVFRSTKYAARSLVQDRMQTRSCMTSANEISRHANARIAKLRLLNGI